jgi:hypothetical protein
MHHVSAAHNSIPRKIYTVRNAQNRAVNSIYWVGERRMKNQYIKKKRKYLFFLCCCLKCFISLSRLIKNKITVKEYLYIEANSLILYPRFFNTKKLEVFDILIHTLYNVYISCAIYNIFFRTQKLAIFFEGGKSLCFLLVAKLFRQEKRCCVLEYATLKRKSMLHGTRYVIKRFNA